MLPFNFGFRFVIPNPDEKIIHSRGLGIHFSIKLILYIGIIGFPISQLIKNKYLGFGNDKSLTTVNVA